MVSKRHLGLYSMMLLFLAQATCAPKAVMVEGEIAQQVEQGIAGGKESFDHSKFDVILRRYARPETHQFD